MKSVPRTTLHEQVSTTCAAISYMEMVAHRSITVAAAYWRDWWRWAMGV